jgi:hypothetical protein
LSLRKKSEPTSISEVKTFKTYFLFPRLPLVTRIKFLHLSSIHTVDVFSSFFVLLSGNILPEKFKPNYVIWKVDLIFRNGCRSQDPLAPISTSTYIHTLPPPHAVM